MIQQFNELRGNMQGLGNGMGNILYSTQEVVKYNGMVKAHVEQLTKETDDVTKSIEEANVLIDKNRTRSHNTKEVIDELALTVENLKLYY